jgi:Na+/H+ antiporter NhaB
VAFAVSLLHSGASQACSSNWYELTFFIPLLVYLASLFRSRSFSLSFYTYKFYMCVCVSGLDTGGYFMLALTAVFLGQTRTGDIESETQERKAMRIQYVPASSAPLSPSPVLRCVCVCVCVCV